MFTDEQKKEILIMYTSEMEIIKLRVDCISKSTTRFTMLEPQVEFMALQMRKIIEQIILASLITNADIYSQFCNRFYKEWEVSKICAKIRKLNPDYLPVAVDLKNVDRETILDDAKNTLNEKELLRMHGEMGKLLHAHNPYDGRIDYAKEKAKIVSFSNMIISYLSVHTIKLYDQDNFLYVVMQSPNHNGRVAINWFSKVDEQNEV